MAVQEVATSAQSSHRPQITLRHATPADAPSISQIGIYTFTQTFGHSMSAHDLQAYLSSSYSLEATTKDILDLNKNMLVATLPALSQPQASPSSSPPSHHPPSHHPDESKDTEDVVVGFALLTRGTTEPCLSTYAQDTLIELQRLYVHPHHHGLGAGTLLARELESIARQQGFKYMWLGVWEENLKAQRVYEKLGYRRVGDHNFVMGDEVQTDWLLVKEL
ncbi:hypothetical protein H2200_012116 [Cladophialophora chaetospira]|uniref:N-acetyltransferase domain-containing protein n=1 Tax=Cladophialophora chaetospira TaxID=386627 RepID=A0AA38WY94_9EURO|nr:hypothetical protein H2200_012116 [Cladophialophora chaetospira]